MKQRHAEICKKSISRVKFPDCCVNIHAIICKRRISRVKTSKYWVNRHAKPSECNKSRVSSVFSYTRNSG